MRIICSSGVGLPHLLYFFFLFFRKVDSTSIDKLFGAPDKIEIPERYVPEKEAAESASSGSDGGEERRRKMEKVESIRRMLGAQAPSTAGGPSQSAINLNEEIYI